MDSTKRYDADCVSVLVSEISSESNSQKCDQTEWAQVSSQASFFVLSLQISFHKCLLLQINPLHSYKLKLFSRLQNASLDVNALWSRIIPKPLILGKSYTFDISTDEGILGKLHLCVEEMHLPFPESTPRFFQFDMGDKRVVDTIVFDLDIEDRWDTRASLFTSLILHGTDVYDKWSEAYQETHGHLKLIRDSLLKGLQFRICRLQLWLNDPTSLPIIGLKEKIICIREAHDRSQGARKSLLMTIEHRKHVLYWNSSWLKQSSKAQKFPEASKVYRIYIHQAIHKIDDMLNRQLRLIQLEIQKIHQAASTSTRGNSSFAIVHTVKVNLLEICIQMNDLVSSLLMEISKNQEYMEPFVTDISRLMNIVHVQIMPNLVHSQKSGGLTLGQLLVQITQVMEEMAERVKRLMKLQGLRLTASCEGQRLSKKPWWSGLLYEAEFLQLIELISLSFQKLSIIYSDFDNGSLEFWSFLIKTGMPVIFYSHIVPDESNMDAFEDLAYRLVELSRRVKISFHPISSSSNSEIHVTHLDLILSFPMADLEFDALHPFQSDRIKVDIHPLLFLPKKPDNSTKWSEHVTQSISSVESRATDVNVQTFKILDSYLTRIKDHTGVKFRTNEIIKNELDTSFKVLKSEIDGQTATFYLTAFEKDIQITLLASRCMSNLGRSIMRRFFESDQLSHLTGIWIQTEDKKSAFTIEDADHLYQNHGVSVGLNW